MGEIRKISIGLGNSEDTHHFQVGTIQIAGKFKITLIEKDENYAELTGHSKYLVWVQEVNRDKEVVGKAQIWVESERQPVLITYDVKPGILLKNEGNSESNAE